MNKILPAAFSFGVALLLAGCATAPGTPAGQAEPPAATSLSAAPSQPVAAKKAVTRTLPVRVPRVVRDETRYADNTLSQYSAFAYDASGYLVKEESYNQKKQLVLRKLVTRSPDAPAETEITYNQLNEVQGIAQREYDPQGRLVQESLLNARKELQSIAEYTWDAAGNPVSWISRGRDRSVIVSTVYRMQDGALRAIELTDGEGKPITRFELTPDAQGRPARKVEIDASGTRRNSIEYGYEKDLLAREDYRKADGSLIRTIEYAYDGRGVPVQIKYLDRQGRVVEIRSLEYQMFDRTETVTVYE